MPSAQSNDAVARARASAVGRAGADESCPVCKSSAYLNQGIFFMVNPECYHKMCHSCVERLFSHGPAPCPIVGCTKILRRQKFRRPTFEDLVIEKEVDIRRRLAKVFNKREEDFPTLRAYNDYLEEQETIAYNLTYSIDLPETESRVLAYESANKQSITQNAARAAAESQAFALHVQYERDAHRKAREIAAQEFEEEKRDKIEAKAAIIRALQESGESASDIIADVRRQERKKSSMRKENQERRARELQAAKNAPAFQFLANLKREGGEVGGDEGKYDPLDGVEETNKYFVYRDRYENPWLENAWNDKSVQAGGYLVSQYCQRAIFEAFSGIGCFIEDDEVDDSTMDTPMTDAAPVAVT